MKFLRENIELIRYMVISGARSESRQLYAGLAWWIIEPVCYMVVMYLVFGVILERGGPGFVGFLLVGFVFWRWNDGSIKMASMSLVSARSILTQAKRPAWLFPLSEVLSMLLRFLIVLLLLAAFAGIYTGRMSASYLALPLVLAANVLFIFSLGWLLALLVPFFPDSRKIIDSGFQLLFFASGIFYDINQLAPAIAEKLYLNPIARFLDMYRGIMLEHTPPSGHLLSVPLASTAMLLLAACIAQRYLAPRLAKALMQ